MITYTQVIVTPFGQNCRIFVNTDTKEAVVSDPGAQAAQIVNSLDEHGIKIKAILITHMHLDHIGAVSRLAEITGAKIYGSAIEDAPLLEHVDDQSKAFNLPYTDRFDTTYLKDNQIITPIDGLKLQVIQTPGHTKGGVCYYCEKENFVITGDTLFLGSIGRTDFEGGNFDEIISSIKNKLFKLPPDTIVLPGHGPNTTIGDEMSTNPYVS